MEKSNVGRQRVLDVGAATETRVERTRYSPNSTWLVTSRLDTTRRVESMHFGRVELDEQHGSTRLSRRARHVERVVSCRDLNEPSGIWAYGRAGRTAAERQQSASVRPASRRSTCHGDYMTIRTRGLMIRVIARWVGACVRAITRLFVPFTIPITDYSYHKPFVPLTVLNTNIVFSYFCI